MIHKLYRVSLNDVSVLTKYSFLNHGAIGNKQQSFCSGKPNLDAEIHFNKRKSAITSRSYRLFCLRRVSDDTSKGTRNLDKVSKISA